LERKAGAELKKLLMGNEAIALGAIRAGVSVVSGYPGTPSTEILETVAREVALPGSPAAEIYVEWSVNEKSALEVAAGAAVSGARALVTMKQVGLNVASDPLMSLNYLGVSGALVVVVADDPGPISSQTEQDSRHFARYAKLAAFDPANPEEAFLMTADAFDFSEKYGRPVILRPTTRVCHSYASVDLDTLPVRPRKAAGGFDKAGGRWVIFPPLALKNHEIIESDLIKMGNDFSSYRGNSLVVTPNVLKPQNDDSLPGGNGLLGIAAGGVSYTYAMETLSPLPPGLKILKIGTFPFPAELALSFLEGLDEVLVLEELDPVIEDELLKICGSRHLRADIRGKRSGDMPRAGEYTPALAAEKIEAFLKRRVWVHLSDLEKEKIAHSAPVPPPVSASLASARPETLAAAANAADVHVQILPEPPPLPLRPPVLCAGCPHRGSFFAVKEAVRKYGKGRKATYSGDIGCYTLGNAQPLEMTDTCLCMGAGITMAQGIGRVEKDTLCFAFIGDSTFFHTGISGLVNAVYNRSDIVVVVLDNSTTAMTGNQPHPGLGIDALGREAGKISIPALAAALGIQEIARANPFDLEKAEAAVRQVMDKPGVRLVIFEGPCIFNRDFQKKAKNRCVIDPGKCTGCMNCIKKLGCPAISIATKGGSADGPGAPAAPEKVRAVIDPGLCTGCGICRNLCPSGAIDHESPAVPEAGVPKGGPR